MHAGRTATLALCAISLAIELADGAYYAVHEQYSSFSELMLIARRLPHMLFGQAVQKLCCKSVANLVEQHLHLSVPKVQAAF